MAMCRLCWCFAVMPMWAAVAFGQSETPSNVTPKPLSPQIVNQSQPLPEKPSALTEKLTPIRPQLVDLQWRDDRWVLVNDNVTIKDFGRQEREARAALALIRQLGLTQYGTIGSPQPILEYWLANGHAPSGPARGLHLRPIDLPSLRVEEAQKQWVVRDNYQILFNFGASEQDARQASAVLQHYGFTQIGALGAGVPTMLILFGGSEQSTQHAMQIPHMAAQGPTTSQAPSDTVGTPNPYPTSQHTSPLKSHDASPKEGNHGATPSIALLPQGQQLAAPSQAMPEMTVERVPFDWRQLQARKEGQDWQVRAGQYTLAHFGSDRASAEKALNVLQFYRCNEQCRVGGQQPVFTYYLANGQAPRGQMLGLGSMAIQCDSLKVHQVGEAWTIADGNHIVFSFDHEEPAKQVLQALQKHKFDHICRIGHGETPAVTLLVRMN